MPAEVLAPGPAEAPDVAPAKAGTLIIYKEAVFTVQPEKE
jgi:hypothetical protein